MNAKKLIDTYISFFVHRKHKQIANSPLLPENDPTTLFISSGMQPLVTYLLGEKHPEGTKLVNVQNSFRAVDIDEVGDNRHNTFFRMLGNWSLGDYFKKEEIPWLWDFLTKELKLPKEKLFITVFKGDENVEKDNEAFEIWETILKEDELSPKNKIFFAGVDKNWWSRTGPPENMPIGEPGGPDTEVYYRFDDVSHAPSCKDNPVDCECGKFLEIANSVFMQYVKTANGFKPLPKQNVDFGGGVERLLAAIEDKSDIFKTSLFFPIINSIENESGKSYAQYQKEMQIIADHLVGSCFIIAGGIYPSNRQQGYILRRLLRRAFDNFQIVEGENIAFVLETIIDQYTNTDKALKEKYEDIKNIILEEKEKYENSLKDAKRFLEKEYIKELKINVSDNSSARDGIKGIKVISPELAFKSLATYGLGPVQLKNLGYSFDDQALAEQIKKHKELSKTSSAGMFKGGLADHSEITIMGHTATHLMHQALRDILGDHVYQTGSNITTERIRFDFNFEHMPTQEEIKQVEDLVNEKIKENLPVHFEIMPLDKAKKLGAIGLFDDKYATDVKVYFVGNYSREFCGGPHVDFTGALKKFKIIKVDNIGKGQKRIYSKVNNQI